MEMICPQSDDGVGTGTFIIIILQNLSPTGIYLSPLCLIQWSETPICFNFLAFPVFMRLPLKELS